MIKRLYEAVTRQPWTTSRSCTSEFGPTIAVRYAAELAGLSDDELCAMSAAEAVLFGEQVRALRLGAIVPQHVLLATASR